MDYFKLLQLFCIKYRLSWPTDDEGNNLEEEQITLEKGLKKYLSKEQYEIIEAIYNDNTMLLGKSPFSDQNTFFLVKNRHVERLKKLGYSSEEIKQALPTCLKGDRFLSLVSSTARYLLKHKEKLLSSEKLSLLPADLIGVLNELDADQTIASSSPKLAENVFLVEQLNCLLTFVKEKKNPINSFDLRKLACIVAYGSLTDVENIFRNNPEIINDSVPLDEDASWGLNYLYYAIHANNFINFQCLLEWGADPTLLDKQRDNLWHHVFDSADLSFIKSLLRLNQEKNFLEKIDVNAKNANGWTPLHCIALNDRVDRLKELFGEKFLAPIVLDEKCNVGLTPLGMAMELENYEVAKFLIGQGADVNIVNANGNTPLHQAIYSGRKDLVELLIQKGANVNAVNHKNKTPLHLAVHGRNEAIVQLLIKNGAELNTKNDKGKTALDIALMTCQPKVARFLFAASCRRKNMNKKKDVEVANKNEQEEDRSDIRSRII